MEVFLGEWLNLLLRWAHMVVGIGWIGTSFYFMALDYTLTKRERMSEGVLGTSWQVHGGGFYHVEKYTVAPPALPEVLHWFKWEAYLTWVTGFGLLIVQYYFHAEAYLIDPTVMPLTPWRSTWSACLKASSTETLRSLMDSSRSFGMTMRVSTSSRSCAIPSSAELARRRPSKANGRVTTPIVRAPRRLASFRQVSVNGVVPLAATAMTTSSEPISCW